MRDITMEEVIEQLEDLRRHCEDMIDEADPNDVFRKDAIALDIAIAKLKDLKKPASLN